MATFKLPVSGTSVAPIPHFVRAVEHVRRMRGASQSQLMRCSDGRYYVVKFPNNPQGIRILANELLGGRLAALLGLPVAAGELVMVEEKLVFHSKEMFIELGYGRTPCQPGLCFGSLVPTDRRGAPLFDFLPDSMLGDVKNVRDFLGMLIFDLWTCNTDGRQVIFSRNYGTSRYLVTMVDHGFCFNAHEWNFPDSPLRGLYWRPAVYETVTGMDAFEPWLSRLESEIDEVAISESAEGIPTEWRGADDGSFPLLLNRLNRRRMLVRELLLSVRKSAKHPFPNWARVVDAHVPIKPALQENKCYAR